MGRKQKKYHYIYKTTCIVTGRFYIGMHSTDNIDDGYVGSGKRLWNSINYHGKENHVCEILEYCKDRQELKKREEEIVNPELLNEDLCMNLTTGGTGGFVDEEHMMKCSKAGNKKQKKLFETDPEWAKNKTKNSSKNGKKAYLKGKFKYSWLNKTHSEETKKKISESMKGQGSGSLNSQFGSCWITNEVDNKKIKRGDVIPDGWRLGRKIK